MQEVADNANCSVAPKVPIENGTFGGHSFALHKAVLTPHRVNLTGQDRDDLRIRS